MDRTILTDKISYPIILFETGPKKETAWDLQLFEEIHHAEIAVEAIDVRDEMFMIFDAEGRLLKYNVDDKDGVYLTYEESNPAHAEKLMFLLRYMLFNDKTKPEHEHCSLKEMLDMARNDYMFDPGRPLRKILWSWLKRLFGRSKE